MCIVFVALRSHKQFPVIVAANRDEFVTRETERCHRWARLPAVLAGRDGVAGGTWMGVNVEDGRWSSLVNVAPPHGALVDADAPSRGLLAEQFLAASPAETPALFAQRMGHQEPSVRRMAGHSMVVGDALGRVAYYCNRPGGGPGDGGRVDRWRECRDGIFAFSNDAITGQRDSCWAKASRGKARMAEVVGMSADGAALERGLFEMLCDPHKDVSPAARYGYAPGGERSGSAFESYAAAHPERPEIPIFIPPPALYRTRCSTLLLIDAHQNITYIERSHDDGSQPGHVAGTRRFYCAAAAARM
jgi:uncharacterized protein with NRDE domain